MQLTSVASSSSGQGSGAPNMPFLPQVSLIAHIPGPRRVSRGDIVIAASDDMMGHPDDEVDVEANDEDRVGGRAMTNRP
jgi:hypothetical protein